MFIKESRGIKKKAHKEKKKKNERGTRDFRRKIRIAWKRNRKNKPKENQKAFKKKERKKRKTDTKILFLVSVMNKGF